MKTKIREFFNKLYVWFVFFTQTFNYRYSKEWDEELNRLLDIERPILDKPNSIDGKYYWLYLRDTIVWIQNYPYGFGLELDENKDTIKVRPSKKTILRLKKVVDVLKNKERFKKRITRNTFKLLRGDQKSINK